MKNLFGNIMATLLFGCFMFSMYAYLTTGAEKYLLFAILNMVGMVSNRMK